MDAPFRGLLTCLTVLLVSNGIVGTVLTALPYNGPEFYEVIKEGVGYHIDEDGFTSSMSTFDELQRGRYEVWAVDINPGILDYGGVHLELDGDGEPPEVDRSTREENREIDGVRYEVVWHFTIARGGLYSYGFGPIDPALNGTSSEFIFMRQATRLDQPMFVAGMAIVLTVAVSIPILVLAMRRPHRPIKT